MNRLLKAGRRVTLLSMVIMSIAACSSNQAAEDPAVQTRLARQMAELQKLKAAEYADYTSAMNCEETNRKLGNYYARKGSEAHGLISQLENGEQVSDAEISRALDDSDSTQFYDRPPMPLDY
jgi:hypothetical protein